MWPFLKHLIFSLITPVIVECDVIVSVGGATATYSIKNTFGVYFKPNLAQDAI